MSRTGATPRVLDGGSKAGTRGLGAAARDPPILGSPGSLAALGQQGPRYLPPPHRPLLTSRCPSLCLHHNPSRHSSHGPSHFPPGRLSRRQESRRTPRPAKHQTSLPTREAPPSEPRLLADWLVQTAYLSSGRGLGASREARARVVGGLVEASPGKCRVGSRRFCSTRPGAGGEPSGTPAGLFGPASANRRSTLLFPCPLQGLGSLLQPGCVSQIRGFGPRPRRG